MALYTRAAIRVNPQRLCYNRGVKNRSRMQNHRGADAALPTAQGIDRADSPRTLGVILFSRIALNLQIRVVYPFLPAIGRGLGVPLETASLLLTVRSLVSLASPLYGALADRYGRRGLMLAGLAALVIGALLVAAAPGLGLALVAFALLGLSKSSYDPAMQAYLSDAVPYERRGRVFGITELAWSLSWFIGVPATGFIIASAGWRAPFWLIAGLGAAALLATWRLCRECGRRTPPPLPPGSDGNQQARDPENRADQLNLRPGAGPRPAWATRMVLATLSAPLLMALANENIGIIYGAWLETQFGLTVAALGVASLVISAAELLGEGLTAWLVDRLGKQRTILAGLLLNVAAYLAFPHLTGTLAGGLTGLFLVFLTFEFTIVATIPFISELAPQARGTVMALFVTAAALGRMISSLIAPRLWAAGGLQVNARVSAAVVAVAVIILWSGAAEHGRTSQLRR